RHPVMASIQKALGILRNMPRVCLANIAPMPGAGKTRKNRRGRNSGGRKRGMGDKGQGGRVSGLPRLGFEGGQTPLYLRVPLEKHYNKDNHLKRQYPPLSLIQLQRLIDLGRIDTSQPIDLPVICNQHIMTVDPFKRHFGVHLTDEGAECFKAKVHIEVQWADVTAIAAIERNGGKITTRFFDLPCLHALVNPLNYFKMGTPIPRCRYPPNDALEYYTCASYRGYLADPEEVETHRQWLANYTGYKLPSKDTYETELMQMKKHNRQIFYGLEPGWVVNLADKCILKPKSEELRTFYQSQ
ncbi:unnamed protein product, partial [Owenia fusiformis]